MFSENNNHIFILYSRVSTGSIIQCTSLCTQIKQLKQYANLNNCKNIIEISDVISVSNGISQKLRNCILQYKNKIIYIFVTRLDRLTRDVNDIGFVINNINFIVTINDDRVYKTDNDSKIILSHIETSSNEIVTLKSRQKYNFSFGKRKRNTYDLYILARLRLKTICEIIINIYPQINIHEISELIKLSQQIHSHKNLIELNTLFKKFNIKSFNEDYKELFDLKQIENIYYITRKDLYLYINIILKNIDLNLDEHILKQFVNANINISKYMLLLESEQNNANTDQYDDDQYDDGECMHQIKKIKLN